MFLPICADGPRRRLPVATLGIAVANLAVLLYQLALPDDGGVRLLYAGGAVPYEVAHFTDLIDGALHPRDVVPPPLTVFTAMFLHGGLEHIAGNVWFLWVFGRHVEATMGSGRFFLFYLGVGTLAAIAQVAMTPSSQVPMVGASGAIAGVLGAYLRLYPRGRVQVLVFLLVVVQAVVVPAFAALGAWFLWQVLTQSGDGSVATWAHLAGFLVGVASCTLLARRAHETRGPRVSWSLSPVIGTSSSPR